MIPNQEHLILLTNSVEAWNQWRKHNPNIVPHLQNANLSKSDLRGANLDNANLEEAILYGANLTQASLENANLKNAVLTSAICFNVTLKNANLSNAYLTQTDLSKSDLRGANLSNAYLIETYLVNSNLKNANLQGADLSNSYLTGANLTTANLEGAIITGTDISATIALAQQKEVLKLDNLFTETIYSEQEAWEPIDQTWEKISTINLKYISDTSESFTDKLDYLSEVDKLRLENERLKLQVKRLSQKKSPLFTDLF